MFKSTSAIATNNITVVGTLIDVTMREGTAKSSGTPYRSGSATIRVNQTYGGKAETSDIPLNFIAMKFKKDGTINPAYEDLGKFSSVYKSAKNFPIIEATRLRVSGKSGTLAENMFATQQDPEKVISTWRLNANFFNEARSEAADCATFNADIFIMQIEREMTSEGEETGRLKIRGAIVQYGQKLDVLNFIVEDPTAVDYIERNYNVNDTVNVVGRIRYTSETVELQSESTWGEAIPQTSTKKKHELIITRGSDEAFDEEQAYNPDDIRVLNEDRNNRKEQVKIDAKNRASKPASSKPATAATEYGWE